MRTLHDFSVNVKVKELLRILKENRTQHEKQHKAAVREFRNRAIELLIDKLEHLKADTWRSIDPKRFLHFGLQAPKSYAHVYTDVIDMLEMAQDDTIAVESHQFRSWVKDEWDWTPEFVATNSAYLGG